MCEDLQDAPDSMYDALYQSRDREVHGNQLLLVSGLLIFLKGTSNSILLEPSRISFG